MQKVRKKVTLFWHSALFDSAAESPYVPHKKRIFIAFWTPFCQRNTRCEKNCCVKICKMCPKVPFFDHFYASKWPQNSVTFDFLGFWESPWKKGPLVVQDDKKIIKPLYIYKVYILCSQKTSHFWHFSCFSESCRKHTFFTFCAKTENTHFVQKTHFLCQN